MDVDQLEGLDFCIRQKIHDWPLLSLGHEFGVLRCGHGLTTTIENGACVDIIMSNIFIQVYNSAEL